MPRDTITLGEIAHARSGDKGNHANVGVVAYTPAGYDFCAARADQPTGWRSFFAPLGHDAG